MLTYRARQGEWFSTTQSIMLATMNEKHDDADSKRTALPSSPELMSPDDTGLLVVDMQERFLNVIPESERLVWNARRLLDGAVALGVPAATTEQYPEKLGPTVAQLAEYLPDRPSKLAFSCGERGEIFADWAKAGRHRVLICGIETHVCVQQTALDLLADGFRVYLAVDALGTRHAVDHEIALRRLEMSGATLTTVEAALFELCRVAGTPQFKKISKLAKEQGPGV